MDVQDIYVEIDNLTKKSEKLYAEYLLLQDTIRSLEQGLIKDFVLGQCYTTTILNKNLYIRIIEIHNTYVLGLVVEDNSIYVDSFGNEDFEVMQPITTEEFEKVLKSVCYYYISDKYTEMFSNE